MSRTDAIVAKQDCSDGNVGEVRLHDPLASCEQNVKPIGVDGQTIGVRAIFGYVAEKLACLALSTWAYSVVVALWLFFAVTQSAYVFSTQMTGLPSKANA